MLTRRIGLTQNDCVRQIEAVCTVLNVFFKFEAWLNFTDENARRDSNLSVIGKDIGSKAPTETTIEVFHRGLRSQETFDYTPEVLSIHDASVFFEVSICKPTFFELVFGRSHN
ncbi:hypothetical protein EMIT0P395_20391 [Pseudomonas sp. IT-P395]